MDLASVSTLPRYSSIDGGSQRRHETGPLGLILDGQHILAEGDSRTPLYYTSRDVTTVRQPSSSIHLERVDHPGLSDKKCEGDEPPQKQHVFYLVHPLNADRREDVPAAYFATANAPGVLGNLILDIQPRKLQKPEYRVTLCKGRSATSEPLFDDAGCARLFTVKPNLRGDRYTWTDAAGTLVATEHAKSGSCPRLEITECLIDATRDALVAAWSLRVWSDVAESREAKRDALERLTPADGWSGMSMKWSKRTTALAGFAGAAGGG